MWITADRSLPWLLLIGAAIALRSNSASVVQGMFLLASVISSSRTRSLWPT